MTGRGLRTRCCEWKEVCGMRNILRKEIKLSASVLSFLFIPFGLMFFLPGYPVLCGVFFVTLGLFQSFQNAREANDILFSALLPIAKCDVVKGKYLFVCLIELCGAVLMSLAVVLRATVFVNAAAYRANALMNANCFALGLAFVIFGLFNAVFVGGFFKTAYQLGKPFVTYIILAFVTLGIGEALHYFPGLEWLNAFGAEHLPAQLLLLLGGIAVYLLLTLTACRCACKRFEKIDL